MAGRPASSLLLAAHSIAIAGQLAAIAWRHPSGTAHFFTRGHINAEIVGLMAARQSFAQHYCFGEPPNIIWQQTNRIYN